MIVKAKNVGVIPCKLIVPYTDIESGEPRVALMVKGSGDKWYKLTFPADLVQVVYTDEKTREEYEYLYEGTQGLKEAENGGNT